MNAHRCETVDLTAARKITACNSVFAPVSHNEELAEAAPFWTDENEPTRVDAPQWQWRDGNGRIIRKADGLPALAPPEKPAVSFKVQMITMFCAALTVAVIMAWFDWMVR